MLSLQEKEENINHFVLYRKYNSQFRDMVFNILGISGAPILSGAQFYCNHRFFKEKKIIFLVQLYILLRLWCNMAL